VPRECPSGGVPLRIWALWRAVSTPTCVDLTKHARPPARSGTVRHGPAPMVSGGLEVVHFIGHRASGQEGPDTPQVTDLGASVMSGPWWADVGHSCGRHRPAGARPGLDERRETVPTWARPALHVAEMSIVRRRRGRSVCEPGRDYIGRQQRSLGSSATGWRDVTLLASGVEPHEHQLETPMRPATVQVLAPHADQWWPADVLDQYRGREGCWRVVVRFTTAPGSTYVLAMPADLCRRGSDPYQQEAQAPFG
jgi:hypothetical protein